MVTRLRSSGVVVRRSHTPPAALASDGPEAGASAFVWGTWGLSTLALIGFVACYGSNVPRWDDYSIVPQLAGVQPVTLRWLWEQHNEHRIPLPKLIMITASRLAGNDVRAEMYLTVLALSGLSAALIVLRSRSAGGLRSSDAVFPLLLLSVGQAANLLWGHQFHQVISMTLGTAYLVPMVARPSWPGRMTLVLAGLGLALLPLCGGTGLLFVPGLELWLFGMAVATIRSGGEKRWLRVGTLALAMLPGVTVTALYFRGFRKGFSPDAPGGIFDNVRTGLQFLTGGIGTPGAALWPWSGFVTLGLITLSIVFLIRAWFVRPDERPRVFGLTAFLACMLSIAAAVGWGRGWSGRLAGFQDRFITMAIPVWCWFAFVFRLYTPANLGRLALNIVFATLCVCVWPNAQFGLHYGRDSAARNNACA